MESPKEFQQFLEAIDKKIDSSFLVSIPGEIYETFVRLAWQHGCHVTNYQYVANICQSCKLTNATVFFYDFIHIGNWALCSICAMNNHDHECNPVCFLLGHQVANVSPDVLEQAVPRRTIWVEEVLNTSSADCQLTLIPRFVCFRVHISWHNNEWRKTEMDRMLAEIYYSQNEPDPGALFAKLVEAAKHHVQLYQCPYVGDELEWLAGISYESCTLDLHPQDSREWLFVKSMSDHVRTDHHPDADLEHFTAAILTPESFYANLPG